MAFVSINEEQHDDCHIFGHGQNGLTGQEGSLGIVLRRSEESPIVLQPRIASNKNI